MSAESRRASNQASYRRAKPRQEAALLRLDKGDLARLDAARSVAGLSRSAFAKLYLLPMAEAVSSRLAGVEAARTAARVSLATFIGRAIDGHLAAPGAVPSAPVSDEFDSLFAPKEDAC